MTLPAAERLAKVAREAGWDAEIVESDGEWNGRPVHQTVLRLRRGDERAAAAWEGSTYRSGFVLGRMTWTTGARAFPWRVGAKRLREVVEGGI